MSAHTESVLAIAPHPDDVALSCGGIMRKMRGIDLTLLTCFSKSRYAPLVDLDTLSVEEISNLRSLEDKKYATRVNAKRIDFMLDAASLRFSEASLRLQESPKHDDTYYHLVASLTELFENNYFTVVLCPFAIGNHVDHHLVKDAVESIQKFDFQIWYYEDLPYSAWIGGAKAVEALIRSKPNNVYPSVIDISNKFEAKLADIVVYESQVSLEDISNVSLYAEELGIGFRYGERIWHKQQDKVFAQSFD